MQSRKQHAVNTHFRPEFINQLDDIVYFQPLQPQYMIRIIQVQLQVLARLLAECDIGLQVSGEVLQWFAQKGYDLRLGARSLNRLIDGKFKNTIGGLILEGRAKPSDIIFVDIQDQQLIFTVQGNDTLLPEGD